MRIWAQYHTNQSDHCEIKEKKTIQAGGIYFFLNYLVYGANRANIRRFIGPGWKDDAWPLWLFLIEARLHVLFHWLDEPKRPLDCRSRLLFGTVFCRSPEHSHALLIYRSHHNATLSLAQSRGIGLGNLPRGGYGSWGETTVHGWKQGERPLATGYRAAYNAQSNKELWMGSRTKILKARQDPKC